MLASMRVTARDNLSPESEGRRNARVVRRVMRVMGKIRFRT